MFDKEFCNCKQLCRMNDKALLMEMLIFGFTCKFVKSFFKELLNYKGNLLNLKSHSNRNL